jgi:hypothetical protein
MAFVSHFINYKNYFEMNYYFSLLYYLAKKIALDIMS